MGAIFYPPKYRGRPWPTAPAMTDAPSFPGPFTSTEIADMVATYGLAAMYDTAVSSSITSSAGRVVTLADLTGLGRSPTQAAPANRPLVDGARVYGPTNWPSIKFTGANAERLQFAANLIAGSPATMIMVARCENPQTSFAFGNVSAGGTAGWSLGYISTPARNSVAAGVVARTTSSPSLSEPEVWVARDPAAATAARLSVNGGSLTLTNATSVRTTPGGTGQIVIGSLVDASQPATMDFLFGAIFTQEIPDLLLAEISARICGRLGTPLIVDVAALGALWLRGGDWSLDGSNNVQTWNNRGTATVSYPAATQATPANRPPPSALQSGRPGIKGDGASKWMTLAGPTAGPNNTIIFVATRASASQAIAGFGNTNLSLLSRFIGYDFSFHTYTGWGPVTMPAGAHILTLAQTDGSKLTLYADGVASYSGAPFTPVGGSPGVDSLLRRDDGFGPTDGAIFEVIHIPSNLTTSAPNFLAAVHAQLKSYYGLGTFDPTRVTGLLAWWKYDSGLTIVPGTSFHWLDKIGGKDLAQTTGARVPTTTTLAGKLVPTGDGVDDYVQASFALVPPYTILYALRQTVASAHACQIGGANGGVTTGIYFGQQPNATARLFLSGSTEINIAGESIVNTPYVYSGSTSGSQQILRTSGVIRAVGSSVANTDTQGIRVFAAGDGSVPAGCQISEILVYSRVLTDTEKLNIERYLAAQIGAACV